MSVKKLFFIMVVQIFVAKYAFAQKGLHGNSDWKVPIPIISPQMQPQPTINIIQIAVPSIPAIPGNIVPAVPATPATPATPKGSIAGPSGGELKMEVPKQQLLPPLPPIPPSPTVKMPTN